MPEPLLEPDELLFTEMDGTRTSLQDLIYDGLDRDYSTRYPALLHLMRHGLPVHRLYSCVMLASWGVPEGMRLLIQWATDPDSTPWAGEPVTYDRFYGVDDAFEMLANAMDVAREFDLSDEIAALRDDAVRALLGIYHRVHFGRSLLIVLDLDTALTATLKPEIAVAVDRSIAASQTSMPFDMAAQAAFLLGILASLDDEHAARAGEALFAAHPENIRTAREVAYALGWGTGPATHAILNRLVASPYASVRKDAQDSISRREKAAAEGLK